MILNSKDLAAACVESFVLVGKTSTGYGKKWKNVSDEQGRRDGASMRNRLTSSIAGLARERAIEFGAIDDTIGGLVALKGERAA